jgi:hypothetical protein
LLCQPSAQPPFGNTYQIKYSALADRERFEPAILIALRERPAQLCSLGFAQ